jgi:2-dehydro-3-deoxyglucarate aldolase
VGRSNNEVEIKRLLDAGFYNFLIPMVQNASDAARAVAATRYPPEGVRGVSVSQRSNLYGSVPNYFQEINQHIMVAVQIESPQAVQAAQEIASTAGVDCVFVGPSDLAATYGHLGNAAHPEVQAAIAHIFETCKRAGKPTGILAPVEADARRYMDMGATFVAVGSDLGVFRQATQALKDRYAV